MGQNYGWIEVFVRQLEESASKIDTDGLLKKLEGMKPEVDKVIQNKIEIFRSALIKAKNSHEDSPKD